MAICRCSGTRETWVIEYYKHPVPLALRSEDADSHDLLFAQPSLTCIVGFSVGILSVAGGNGLRAFQVFVVKLVVGGMAGFSIGIVILGLVLKAVHAYLTSD
jgi:hypothetical protein